WPSNASSRAATPEARRDRPCASPGRNPAPCRGQHLEQECYKQPPMRLRPLGKTSISVSELALGTWGLSGDGYGAVPDAEQDRVIERARALGVTTFETADCYAAGDMERRLGKLLPDDGKTVVITKIG